MAPKVIVLSGEHGFERVRNLIHGMVHIADFNAVGGMMIEIANAQGTLSPLNQASIIQPFIRQFTLPDTDDPGFDERIVLEAILYGAKLFRTAWAQQVPGLSSTQYRFTRWLRMDLVLERR